MTSNAANQCDRCNRNSFIYDRDTKFSSNLIACSNQIFRFGRNLVVDFFIHGVQITVDTVQKADSHSDGTHIQIFLFDHLICLINLKNIDHVNSPFQYDPIKYGALH